ncbi:unnamed protein product [Acanthoscelides obtectus]|uniref:Protein phosphatase 1 regulatory subunit 37 n=1 Tax=Acanthoscelides obtectus TaxID=200917 RepID=A0A9P0KQ00_ACAOB|nr:unnamed protein product [Acanthoscelides obtectus]CAK1628622.1 Protein phosphatase 1 regulatory subunit 37 [Acanthoscelides obtectus]
MDLALNQENGTHLLIDSDTKCIGSVVENESDNSDEYLTCEEQIVTKEKLSPQSILDKAFSVDENELATPLQPIQADFPLSSHNETTSDDSISDISAKSDEDDGYVEDNIEEDSNTEENFAADNLMVIEEICEKKEQLLDETNVHRNDEDNPASGLPIIPHELQETELSTGTNDQNLPSITLTSILRRNSSKGDSSSIECVLNNNRKVSFPSEKADLVHYCEPDYEIPWMITVGRTSEEILEVYQQSCKKHKTVELDIIKNQINDITNNMDHSTDLKLIDINITSEVNETIEDLFKVANFHTLILKNCKLTPETLNEFLNMLEFYESVSHLEIEMQFEDDDAWRCFCHACSNIMVLESLSFKKMDVSEHYMRLLLNAVRSNPNITMLKFEGCKLDKLPSFYLVESLMTNKTLRELYLPSAGLYTKEAEVLARFLMNNTHLKVLDIGNNFIGDRGLESLAKGLCKQNTIGEGLSALSIFNNQLTERCGPILSTIIVECKNLHTLNIGYNNLTDVVLNHISMSLPSTDSLEGLGLQCTLLTCKGIESLSEAIPRNQSLQKINLKGNKAIQLYGVELLCQALTNSKINKVEIDETNRSCSDPDAYAQLVKKLFAICTVNKSFTDTTDNEEITNISQLISRKMSLSCEPKYTIPESSTPLQIGSPQSPPVLTPFPSPISSPAPKSRFQIVKVTESGSSCSSTNVSPSPSPKPKSRFKVTKVPPSPDEEYTLGRFANVRSSVSSNDSMDSLTTLHLDSDDSS